MATYTTKFSIGDKVVPAEYFCNGGKVGTVRRVLVHETPVGVLVKYAVQSPAMSVEEYPERDLTAVTTTVSPHYFQD
jgi:hypothetical protein